MSLMYSDVTSNKGEATFCSAVTITRLTRLLQKRPSNLEKGHKTRQKRRGAPDSGGRAQCEVAVPSLLRVCISPSKWKPSTS